MPTKAEIRSMVHEANIIEFGSEGHAALLGLTANMVATSPEAKADIEKQLKIVPKPMTEKDAERKRSIVDPRNYAPRTNRNDGDSIIDGWVRVGGRR